MSEAPAFSLELPDPESDTISSMEFLARIEEAWAICDRFDLQNEIWRGRILRSVRDRERRGGEGRGGAQDQGAEEVTPHLSKQARHGQAFSIGFAAAPASTGPPPRSTGIAMLSGSFSGRSRRPSSGRITRKYAK